MPKCLSCFYKFASFIKNWIQNYNYGNDNINLINIEDIQCVSNTNAMSYSDVIIDKTEPVTHSEIYSTPTLLVRESNMENVNNSETINTLTFRLFSENHIQWLLRIILKCQREIEYYKFLNLHHGESELYNDLIKLNANLIQLKNLRVINYIRFLKRMNLDSQRIKRQFVLFSENSDITKQTRLMGVLFGLVSAGPFETKVGQTLLETLIDGAIFTMESNVKNEKRKLYMEIIESMVKEEIIEENVSSSKDILHDYNDTTIAKVNSAILNYNSFINDDTTESIKKIKLIECCDLYSLFICKLLDNKIINNIAPNTNSALIQKYRIMPTLYAPIFNPTHMFQIAIMASLYQKEAVVNYILNLYTCTIKLNDVRPAYIYICHLFRNLVYGDGYTNILGVLKYAAEKAIFINIVPREYIIKICDYNWESICKMFREDPANIFCYIAMISWVCREINQYVYKNSMLINNKSLLMIPHDLPVFYHEIINKVAGEGFATGLISSLFGAIFGYTYTKEYLNVNLESKKIILSFLRSFH